MQKSVMAIDLPPISYSNDVCESCMKGKQHRQPFLHDYGSRAKSLLQFVLANLSRKMNTQVLGGSSYYFELIDDYSSKTWEYFHKEKSRVFRKFKEWLLMVEVPHNC